MIDRDVLSAKCGSAQVQHRREAEALQLARAAELARGKEVARGEAKLWREISRASGSCERPLAAHRMLVEAKRLHAEARVELQARSRATQRAESVRDHSLEMLLALQRRERLLKEGWRSDESVELSVAAAAKVARRGLADEGPSCEQPRLSPSVPVATIGEAGRRGAKPADEKCLEFGALSRAGQLSALASLASEPEAATLKLTCPDVVGRGSVGLRLSQVEGRSLSVVVRVAEPGALAAVLRERESIVQGLRDAGHEVGALSVEHGDLEAAQDSERGAVLRRRARLPRRRDEDWLA